MKKILTVFCAIGAVALVFITLKVTKPTEADVTASNPPKTEVTKSTDKVPASTQTKSQSADDASKENFTISKIREDIEKWADIERWDSMLQDDDTYKILAVPGDPEEGDGYAFLGAPDNGVPFTTTDLDGNVIHEDNLSTDPKATTVAKVRELLESLKAQ